MSYSLVQVLETVRSTLGRLWCHVVADNHVVLYRTDRVRRLNKGTTTVKLYPEAPSNDLKRWWRQFHMLPFTCGPFTRYAASPVAAQRWVLGFGHIVSGSLQNATRDHQAIGKLGE